MNKTTGRYKETGIVHSWDIWHGAKNLAKMISAAAQQSGQKILLHWLQDIVNHFWFCCKTADTEQQFLKLWSSVLHHVTNKHEWYLGHCRHGALPENQDRQWLESGSKAHKELEAIVFKKRWLRDVHRYLPFRCLFRINPDRGTKVEKQQSKKQQSINPKVLSLITNIADFEWRE
ncbi:hypothetical protein PO909_003710 [Leuciscus waleckii]